MFRHVEPRSAPPLLSALVATGRLELLIEPFKENYEKLLVNRPGCESVHAGVGLCPTGPERTFVIVGAIKGSDGASDGDDSGFNGWEDTFPAGRLEGLVLSGRTTTKVQMPCRNLNALLHAHGMQSGIDYMSVDTEGSELEVLTDLQWEVYAPTVVQVEVNRVFDIGGKPQRWTEKETGLRALMKAKGYHLEREFSSGFADGKRLYTKAFDLIFARPHA